jgi:hypothetical protein
MWTSADWYQHIKRRTRVEEDSCGRQQIGIYHIKRRTHVEEDSCGREQIGINI